MRTNIQALRLHQLQEKLGLKKTKIYSLIKEGRLPPPAKIGRASVWLESEIDKVLLIIFHDGKGNEDIK